MANLHRFSPHISDPIGSVVPFARHRLSPTDQWFRSRLALFDLIGSTLSCLIGSTLSLSLTLIGSTLSCLIDDRLALFDADRINLVVPDRRSMLIGSTLSLSLTLIGSTLSCLIDIVSLPNISVVRSVAPSGIVAKVFSDRDATLIEGMIKFFKLTRSTEFMQLKDIDERKGLKIFAGALR